MKMIVDIDELQAALFYIAQINRVPLSAIEWIKDDQKIEISEDVITEWKFMGLNNTSLFECNRGEFKFEKRRT